MLSKEPRMRTLQNVKLMKINVEDVSAYSMENNLDVDSFRQRSVVDFEREILETSSGNRIGSYGRRRELLSLNSNSDSYSMDPNFNSESLRQRNESIGLNATEKSEAFSNDRRNNGIMRELLSMKPNLDNENSMDVNPSETLQQRIKSGCFNETGSSAEFFNNRQSSSLTASEGMPAGVPVETGNMNLDERVFENNSLYSIAPRNFDGRKTESDDETQEDTNRQDQESMICDEVQIDESYEILGTLKRETRKDGEENDPSSDREGKKNKCWHCPGFEGTERELGWHLCKVFPQHEFMCLYCTEERSFKNYQSYRNHTLGHFQRDGNKDRCNDASDTQEALNVHVQNSLANVTITSNDSGDGTVDSEGWEINTISGSDKRMGLTNLQNSFANFTTTPDNSADSAVNEFNEFETSTNNDGDRTIADVTTNIPDSQVNVTATTSDDCDETLKFGEFETSTRNESNETMDTTINDSEEITGARRVTRAQKRALEKQNDSNSDVAVKRRGMSSREKIKHRSTALSKQRSPAHSDSRKDNIGDTNSRIVVLTQENVRFDTSCDNSISSKSNRTATGSERELDGTHDSQKNIFKKERVGRMLSSKADGICNKMTVLIEVHKSMQLFVCDTCGKGFKTKKSLFSHLRIHETNPQLRKPFGCGICGKHFGYKSDLKKHVLVVHMNHRPYICNYCKKAFGHKTTFLYHMRGAHLKDPKFTRRFVCEKCDKGFSFKYNLVHHHLIHEKSLQARKQFGCDRCKSRLTKKSDLNRHKRAVHDNVRPYNCDGCKQSFKEKRNLRRHIENICKATVFHI